MSENAMLQDILARLNAMTTPLTADQVRQICTEQFENLAKDESFQRKMRFGAPDPKLIGSKYARWGLSVADLEWLYDFQQSIRGLKRVAGYGVYEGPSQELENAWKAVSTAIYLPDEEIRRIDQRALDNEFPRIPWSAMHGLDRELQRRGRWQETQAYADAVRAMDTAESGYGSQLVGAGYVGDLWEAARRDSVVFALLDSFEMRAPTDYLPVEVDVPEMLFVAENTANNASNYGTSKTGSNRVSVAAKKFVIHQMWSGEMEEDSILPFIPFLRRQAELSLAHYSDSVVINGDTTNENTGNINSNDANPADTKHYLAADGLRHIGLVDNTGNQGDAGHDALLYADFTAQRGRLLDRTYLHDWGHPTNPQDLVYVMNPELADAAANLDETITVDKYGPNAVVLNGEITRIGRNPVIASIAVPLSVATGLVEASGNLYGTSICFNRRGAKIGWRRRVKLETERIPATDQSRLVYSLRMGLGRFSPTGLAAGIEWCDVMFNALV